MTKLILAALLVLALGSSVQATTLTGEQAVSLMQALTELGRGACPLAFKPGEGIACPPYDLGTAREVLSANRLMLRAAVWAYRKRTYERNKAIYQGLDTTAPGADAEILRREQAEQAKHPSAETYEVPLTPVTADDLAPTNQGQPVPAELMQALTPIISGQ